MRLVLVTRQSCHLCTLALEVIRQLGAEPELADVDADDELYRLYDWRVPVVLIDGEVAAEGKINRESLRSALDAARLKT
jgi:predicted thioredoxin/glutaredoxin